MRTEYEKATEEVESTVPEETRQETDIPALEQCPGLKAGLWTERMLAALGNGVKGGKWHSMMDKTYAERTLRIAWQRVKSNRGAAGIDKISIERFESKAESWRPAKPTQP